MSRPAPTLANACEDAPARVARIRLPSSGVSTTWGEWVREQMARRRWEQADAARAAGLPRSAISQWLASGQRPTVENVRKFAQAVDVPLVKALVHAGYLTAEEAELPDDHPPSLKDVPHGELLAELADRLGDAPSSHQQQPELPQTEVSWPRPADQGQRREPSGPPEQRQTPP